MHAFHKTELGAWWLNDEHVAPAGVGDVPNLGILLPVEVLKRAAGGPVTVSAEGTEVLEPEGKGGC